MGRAQGSDWVKETKDRLDETSSQVDWRSDLQKPTEWAWTRAGTQHMALFRQGKPQSTYIEKERSGAETAELVYRSSNEGLTATGFNPWRHTTFVGGRPVQVPFALYVLHSCLVSCVVFSWNCFFFNLRRLRCLPSDLRRAHRLSVIRGIVLVAFECGQICCLLATFFGMHKKTSEMFLESPIASKPFEALSILHSFLESCVVCSRFRVFKNVLKTSCIISLESPSPPDHLNILCYVWSTCSLHLFCPVRCWC